MAALAISPGLHELMASYKVSESTVSLSITLPYLVSIPFTLLAGRLSARCSKKGLSLIGLMIICITGLLPYVLRQFTAVLAVRAMMGIGLGLLFTIAPSLAPDYYEEGRMRNLGIGMQSAWAGSGGFVFNILSGYLVQTQARNIFLVYGICAAFFLLILFLLPYQPPRARPAHKTRSLFGFQSLFLALLTFLFLSAGMTLSLSISVYLAERGLGRSIEAGYATSAYSAAAFLTGCLYVFVAKALKDRSVLSACAISALGMLLCVLAGRMLLIYIGAALIGAGLSIFMPSCVNRIIQSAPAESASMGIAVMMVGSAVGQTFSAALINPISAAFSKSTSMRFLVSAVIFVIVGLLSLYQGRNQKAIR